MVSQIAAFVPKREEREKGLFCRRLDQLDVQRLDEKTQRCGAKEVLGNRPYIVALCIAER